MSIDKLEKLRLTDTDPSSITMNVLTQRILCCSECGESKLTLRRIRDKGGEKIKPAKYICIECYKR